MTFDKLTKVLSIDSFIVGSTANFDGNLEVDGGIRKSTRKILGPESLTVSDSSGFIEITGGPYPITLPNPTLPENSGINYKLWQNTLAEITLLTPAGVFYNATGGTSGIKNLVPATTQYWDVWSNGDGWVVFGINVS
jgi:hypothetical protein